jgi:hydroxypyruvate reductase
MHGSLTDLNQAKNIITKTWYEAVNEVKGERAVEKVLENNDLPKPDQIISIGKAASSMFKAAFHHYLKDEKEPENINGLVITKYDHSEALPSHIKHSNIKQWESSHPIPDQNSLMAGKDALECVNSMSQSSKLLLLISGGASSLAEVLSENVSIEDLLSLNSDLLRSGAHIEEINTKRKLISKIKGGKLLSHFKGAHVTTIAISDVPNGNLEVLGSGIGSGTLVNKETTTFNAYLAATNETARNKAAEYANKAGIEIIENSECLYDDIIPLSERLSQSIKTGPKGIYIWGGEPTVKLPDNPGEGGRNQALGLLLAKHIKDEENIAIIVAGTDGTDGPTNAAGAIIDGTTYQTAHEAEKAIKEANAGPYLKSVEALFTSGPTGTNVMDLIIAIKF